MKISITQQGNEKVPSQKPGLNLVPGKITVNNREVDNYFVQDAARELLFSPLQLTENQDVFDIRINVLGGGVMGQAGCCQTRHNKGPSSCGP